MKGVLMVREPSTGKERIGVLLFKEPGLNTRQVQHRVGGKYQNVRHLLSEMQEKRLVDTHLVRRYIPGISWILMNEWKLTKRGEAWLQRENLL